MIKNCIKCEHGCHCDDTCQVGNGCGCLTCEHPQNWFRKQWQKFVDWVFDGFYK